MLNGHKVSYSSSVASLKIGNSMKPAPETVKNNWDHLRSENLFYRTIVQRKYIVVSYSSSVASLKIGNSMEPAPETVKNNWDHLKSENIFFVVRSYNGNS